MFSNDYVSELLIEPEWGLVVHLVVGIHVAYVAVADQVHVTKFLNSTKRKLPSTGVTCVNLNSLNLNWSLHRHLYQSKTGVRMPLTSQIKKLEGFLQKLIKFEPGIIPGRKMRQKTIDWRRWRCGCPRTCGLRGWARCSGAKRNSETNFMFSQELENEKKKPF